MYMVAFLGPNASYTHQAARDRFNQDTCVLSPQVTIEDVFQQVQSRVAKFGVVPFENSTNGSVVFTLDLFADIKSRHPDIVVCGEAYVDVHHCLLGRGAARLTDTSLSSKTDSPTSSGQATPTSKVPYPKTPAVKPVVPVKHVKKLYSHPQAWGQCRDFLSTYLKGVERQDVSSTSRAAELVAEDQSGSSAAISSAIAAEVHGLDVLARNIEDSADNKTRFFILKRTDCLEHQPMHRGAKVVDDDQNSFKSLVSFTVNHEDPGSLADSLAVFKSYKLNLTSINTRPSGLVPWNYIFFIEFKGRRENDGATGAVNAALRDLNNVAKCWRWLGSWESEL
ncbi:prephenate dehydratase [Lineolata rhizophorae]|uniref:prephenate dehydratase n=1 Tax=Lineolata rhizophorae TaxID=578093 RepID=A0A6A6NYI9_9PEZI|nr:prephenate dehydratase [Lineolata rhizophorae]